MHQRNQLSPQKQKKDEFSNNDQAEYDSYVKEVRAPSVRRRRENRRKKMKRPSPNRERVPAKRRKLQEVINNAKNDKISIIKSFDSDDFIIRRVICE